MEGAGHVCPKGVFLGPCLNSVKTFGQQDEDSHKRMVTAERVQLLHLHRLALSFVKGL